MLLSIDKREHTIIVAGKTWNTVLIHQ